MRKILIVALTLLLFAHPAHAADKLDLLATGGKGGWVNTTRPLTRADLQSHPVILLDFWTYGCINCMQVVPDLSALEQQFGDKLLIIGVHSAKFQGESGNDRILAAAQRFGLKHPVANDSDFAIWKAFGVNAWPTLILLNSKGDEIKRFEGEGHRAEIASAITPALAAAPAMKSAPATDLVKAAPDTGPLFFPARLAWDEADKTLIVADTGHNRILGLKDGAIAWTAGGKDAGNVDGAFAAARFDHPRGVVDVGSTIYVADTNNHLLRALDLKTQQVTTLAGTGQRGGDYTVTNAPALKTALASPWDVEPLADGRIAIAVAGLHEIWTYDPKTKTVSTLAGTGREGLADSSALTASLAQPSGLSRHGDTLFFVDAESSSLRELTPDGQVKTLIGKGLFDFGAVDGTYPKARLQHAQGLFAAPDKLYVADTYNNIIRVYDRKTGQLSTVTLPAGSLKEPGDILVVGENAYIADTNEHAIKVLDLESHALSNLAIK